MPFLLNPNAASVPQKASQLIVVFIIFLPVIATWLLLPSCYLATVNSNATSAPLQHIAG